VKVFCKEGIGVFFKRFLSNKDEILLHIIFISDDITWSLRPGL
jgi:hypothetical protein